MTEVPSCSKSGSVGFKQGLPPTPREMKEEGRGMCRKGCGRQAGNQGGALISLLLGRIPREKGQQRRAEWVPTLGVGLATESGRRWRGGS